MLILPFHYLNEIDNAFQLLNRFLLIFTLLKKLLDDELVNYYLFLYYSSILL